MKAGSRDHLNTSSEGLHEEDTSVPNDVCHTSDSVNIIMMH